MNTFKEFWEFVTTHGRVLAEINPGSKEYALGPKDAFHAINLLEDLHNPILGGDILTEDRNSHLKYAYQAWGTKYIYLNWSVTPQSEGESRKAYANRSCELARNKLEQALAVADALGQPCLVALVFDSDLPQLKTT